MFCINSFRYFGLLGKVSRFLFKTLKSCNEAEKLGSVYINFNVKPSGGMALGIFTCI